MILDFIAIFGFLVMLAVLTWRTGSILLLVRRDPERFLKEGERFYNKYLHRHELLKKIRLDFIAWLVFFVGWLSFILYGFVSGKFFE